MTSSSKKMGPQQGLRSTGQHQRELLGDCPLFNRVPSWVADDGEQKIYVYGGSRARKPLTSPTSDFFQLDASENVFRWSDFGAKLRQRLDDRATDSSRVESSEFPALLRPAIAFSVVNRRKVILLFGTYPKQGRQATSVLIAIDVRREEWAFITVGGGSVPPRLDATMHMVGNRLYIFGGRSYCPFASSIDILSTYSIAEYSESDGRWMWICIDRPFPEHIPPLGYTMWIVPIDQGKRLVLFPGFNDLEPGCNITRENLYSFSTEDHSFKPFRIDLGQLPGRVSSYAAERIQSPSGRDVIVIVGWIEKDDCDIPEIWVWWHQSTNIEDPETRYGSKVLQFELGLSVFPAMQQPHLPFVL